MSQLIKRTYVQIYPLSLSDYIAYLNIYRFSFSERVYA